LNEENDNEYLDGFDSDQQEKIKSRRRHRKGLNKRESAQQNQERQEEEWKDLFRILFPKVKDEDIPLPCKFHH
jgi:hypothetical protein